MELWRSGGEELGAALERNKTLRDLYLYGNELGDDGVRGLSAGLENNSSLVLGGDDSLGEEGVALQRTRSLQRRRPNLTMHSDMV